MVMNENVFGRLTAVGRGSSFRLCMVVSMVLTARLELSVFAHIEVSPLRM
jgi:fructoselysine-6-P-deglycase FrlB-like protein